MANLLGLRDITDVLARACRNEISLVDTDRITAQQQLGTIVDNRVFIGRRPQGQPRDFVTMEISEVQREYALSGECEDAQTTVMLMAHSTNRERCWVIAESLRLMFTSFTGTFTDRWGTNVCVGGATFDSTIELSPEVPADASDDHLFEIQLFLRITHQITILT